MTYNSLWALQAEASEKVLADLHREMTAHFSQGPAAFLDMPASVAQTKPYTLANGIAVIPVSGVIDRVARISFFTGLPYTQGQDVIRESVSSAMADPEVKGIMLSVNSPGGVAAGTKELADFIADCGKKKPMAAYADGLTASAAYWLAAATGNIYGPVTAQVGSIGVIAVLTDWTKASEKAGIARTVLASGLWKAAGSPDKSLTDEERQLFMSQLETLHGIFRADVAQRMGITAPAAKWAEGQTVLGEEAARLGLLSQLARDEAEALALFSASITKEEIMDLQTLKAEHPELVDALARETAGKLEQEKLKAVQAQKEETLSLIKAIAGEEIAAKVMAVSEAGITASQIEMLQPLMAGFKAEAKSTEAEERERILAGITQATGQPLPASASQSHKSALLADAERRARAGR